MQLRDMTKLFDNWRSNRVLRIALGSHQTMRTSVSQVPEYRRSRVVSRKIYSSHGLGDLFVPKPVNPSQLDTSEFITGTHVWSNCDKHDYINRSPEDLDAFVELTMQLAAEAQDNYLGRKERRDRSCIRIEGAKGIGKTHLQNYIVSRYSEAFDERRILWIRINMVRQFGKLESLSISDWAKAQMAKVLCRYYDSASNAFSKRASRIECDFRAPLIAYAKSRNEDDERALHFARGQVDTMIDRFRDKNLDQPLDPSWVPPRLVDQVWRIATNDLKLALIVVIDGLDLLSSSVTAKEEFRLKDDALHKYLSSKTDDPVVNLVFQRPESHRTSRGKQRTHDHRMHSPSLPRREPGQRVGPVRGTQLFQQRMDFADENEHLFPSISRRLRENFRKYVTTEPSGILGPEKTPLSFMEALQEIADLNARAVMQLLFIASAKFESRHLKDYKFTELAMMGSEPFPPSTYEFQYDEKGSLERIAGPDYRQFDVLHLPSIFEYPVALDEDARRASSGLHASIYLAGLRVLQISALAETICQDPILGENLIDVLNCLYGYPTDRSELILEEFVEYDLLKRMPYTVGRPEFVMNSRLQLTPKGRMILDHYLYDVSYLAIGAMTSPFPELCLGPVRGRSGLLDNKSPALDKTDDWVRTKIKNSFTMAHALILGNEQQVAQLGERECQTPTHDVRILFNRLKSPTHEIYRFVNRLKSEIPQIATYALKGIPNVGEQKQAYKRLVSDNRSYPAH